VVGGDDLAQIFGIETCRQLGRADQVAEHDRQLSPFCFHTHPSLPRDPRDKPGEGREGWGLPPLGLGAHWRLRGRRCLAAKRRNRVEQPPAVAYRGDPELAQILARQPAQNLSINVVVAERGPILFEPETAQPFAYMHLNCLRKACGGAHYNLTAAACPGWPRPALHSTRCSHLGNMLYHGVRVIVRNTLVGFWEDHPETRVSLERWYRLVRAARWISTDEVQKAAPRAKVLNRERVRFEVAGGNYRLVAAFDFRRQIAFVKFIGTHVEYDLGDALPAPQF
jgi:mRNA interferase HigB